MRLAQRIKRRRLTLNQLVVNPFVSRAQQAACYAKDDPNWDCDEWQSKTHGKLPKRKRKKLTTNRNPLRTDPTRTSALRRAFYRAIQSRLNELKRRVNTLVLTEKSFALNVVTNADYKFLTLPSQVEAFRKWLGQQIVMLFGSTTEQIQESFWYQYVQEGFEKGAGRAFDSMAKSLGLEKGAAKWSFLRSAFGNAVSVDKVKLVAGRVFTELKGVTDAMAQGMTRVLADGLAQGQSPRTVAREMTKQVDDIGSKRALVIARTETSRAHAEGQLIAMEKLGAQRLGVQVEWSPSGLGVTKLGNPSPCPECAKYVGKIYTVEKAQGLIPHHPNCLCSWIPYTQFSKKAPTNNGLAFNVFCATGEGGGVDPTCRLGGRTFYHSTSKSNAKSLEAEGISDEMLNRRDSGFFGEGFYASYQPQDFYGKSLVAVELKKDAKVLDVGELKPTTPQPWHGEFIESLKRRILKHRPDFPAERLQTEIDAVTPGSKTFNHIEYAQEVGRFARSEGYHAAAFSEGQETVIFDKSAVHSIKHLGGLTKAQMHRLTANRSD